MTMRCSTPPNDLRQGPVEGDRREIRPEYLGDEETSPYGRQNTEQPAIQHQHQSKPPLPRQIESQGQGGQEAQAMEQKVPVDALPPNIEERFRIHRLPSLATPAGQRLP